MKIIECPRCGEHKLELMSSYSFCWECGYSPSDDTDALALVAPSDAIMLEALSCEHVLERAS